ncbi:hypothetical protein KFE25_001799 [Diacronema lutheri]|uniref:Uncharacterized protein n=1 Tax=Diacronema lutheri TaxID=2081491 RepID=A0A8J6C9I7_DIALT|nr:hypothetical protein KFE25_001799 [Diacronema lutheri]
MQQAAAGMQQLQRLTVQLNVFNNFFRAVNRLFLNLAMLQRNIVDSPLVRLLVVAAVAAYCVFLLHPCCWLHERFGVDQKVDQLARDAGPIVLVVSVVAFFYYERLTSNASRSSREEGAGAGEEERRDGRRQSKPRVQQPHMV